MSEAVAVGLLPCRVCQDIPDVPELWTDGSGNHSEDATISCKCGVNVSIALNHSYRAKTGDTGWNMISGNWEIALDKAIKTWNTLHAV